MGRVWCEQGFGSLNKRVGVGLRKKMIRTEWESEKTQKRVYRRIVLPEENHKIYFIEKR